MSLDYTEAYIRNKEKMAVKIRLARLGCKNRAFYRIFAADTHTPRDGKHLQVVGFYDPLAGSLFFFLPFSTFTFVLAPPN